MGNGELTGKEIEESIDIGSCCNAKSYEYVYAVVVHAFEAEICRQEDIELFIVRRIAKLWSTKVHTNIESKNSSISIVIS